MMRLIREAAIVFVLAAILGLGLNQGKVRAFFRGDIRPGFLTAEDTAGLVFIGLAEAEDLLARGEATFIDARPRDRYTNGHILNAISLAAEENRDTLSRSLNIPVDTPLVVYCDGGDCRSSVALAGVLRRAGFRNVRVFSGGWAEWSAAGRPSVTGPPGKKP